ncbi:hypothetical protein A0H81_08436 [Grifola frondosa]|uniref:Zn(2)-C6 fungal-type domain-containing protein n=1 Tax=Grifola frondosa TaxID=5627 RepID=A0A1C7M884_GRIFR|nr:hypothetical protein A0H81_08436 [Grifola frondosa]
MQTLQKYTREYLFDKFKSELQLHSPHHALPVRASQPSSAMSRLPPLSRTSRPTLAIDTAHAHVGAGANRHPSLSMPRSGVALNGDVSAAHVASAVVMPDMSPKTASSSRSQRQRAKKITVACNFCRSANLNATEESRHAASVPNDRTPATTRPITNVAAMASSGNNTAAIEKLKREHASDGHLTTPSSAIERRDGPSAVLPPIAHSAATTLGVSGTGSRRSSLNTELPPIATLSVPSGGPAHEDALPSLRSSDSQMTRRRTSSAASGKSRQSGHGSKIVACNFCRARKTRCDGAHPTCGSCSRRSLRCNYVNDPHAKSRSKSTGITPPEPAAPASSRSSPSAQLQLASSEVTTNNGFIRRVSAVEAEPPFQPNKKMRFTADLGAPAIAVVQAP